MKRKLYQAFVLLVIALFINFPIVTAVNISNVQVGEVTQSSAVVTWETDEPADSFVSYGESGEELQTVGDASQVAAHSLNLVSLTPETDYQFSVASGTAIDDNDGQFYTFSTPVPDTEAPLLEVDIPTSVAGETLSLTGTTEVGSMLTAAVNDEEIVSLVAETPEFTFTLPLLPESSNAVLITATDANGNSVSVAGQVFADTTGPQLTLDLPSIVEDTFIEISGIISEVATYDILVNNHSQASGEGTEITERVNLDEGTNIIVITLTDASGFSVTEEYSLISDTQAPFIEAEIERGEEYYEGRAESNINGESEPGATLFLYVYKRLGYEFTPDFSKPLEVTTADSEGQFTFKDVDFESPQFSFEDLVPQTVPSGLQEVSIFPIREVIDAQQTTYYVYIIAEDQTGKSSYWQRTLSVNTCFSVNFDFVPESLGEFQAPLRLNPTLIEQGREEIQAVFRLNYQGDGLPEDLDEPSSAYRITNIDFEKACTQAQVEENNLGCLLLPAQRPRDVLSPDESSVYVSWQLARSADFVEAEDDLWEDFTSKRQLIMPLKMSITYQDRVGENEWGDSKTQTSCYDLGYFVDIPIESSEMIPDFLADETVDALNWTITQMQTIRPILERVQFFSWISCMTSWLGRTVAKWIRLWTAGWESYSSVFLPGGEEKKCPVDQSTLYLESTLEDWEELDPNKLPEHVREAFADPEKRKSVSLDERCPTTASMWKIEAAVDKAYRWTCDRAACRAVPARWTEDKPLDEIGRVIQAQQQCAATGSGIPLIERENCDEAIVTQISGRLPFLSESHNTCWQTTDGTLYVRDPDLTPEEENNIRDNSIYPLIAVGAIWEGFTPPRDRLLAYKPAGSEEFLVGRDETCEQACGNPRREDYQHDAGGGIVQGGEKNGCYREVIVDGEVRLQGGRGQDIIDDRYAAGYTSDCFVDEERGTPGATGLLQCVCLGEAEQFGAVSNDDLTLRTAGAGEEYSYRQDQVYSSSSHTRGTLYPEIQYFSGRDLSGAFGANYLTDYLRSDPIVQEIDPHADTLATFQSVCLPGILKRLTLWESILQGMQNCLVEAKYTGLQDAGMCQAMFARHMCGTFYELIAGFTNSCQPRTFQSQDDGGPFGDVGVFLDGGFDALGDAVDESVTDLRDDYGNAALNEYFKAGGQGFAQSICLGMFSGEWPLFSEDFALEAAYAFPMASSIVVAPATRELSTYNPNTQTATFNYNIGGIILPGCKMRSYNVELKCVGPEDVGPGIDCSEQECDCLYAESFDNALENEKKHPLYRGFALPSGQMVDIPLQSPQVVSTHYRYDHVKVDLYLDPSESDNIEQCFDEEVFFDGAKASFYAPITDISPQYGLSCHVDPLTRSFACPDLLELFGGATTYFVEPGITCRNERDGTWSDCENTPNMFVINDPITTRVHIQSDGEPVCMRRTIVGNFPTLDRERDIPIPGGTTGLLTYEDTVGTVTDALFGGNYWTIELDDDESSDGCEEPTNVGLPDDDVDEEEYEFEAIKRIDLWELRVPDGVSIVSNGYTLVTGLNNILSSAVGGPLLSLDEINNVVFEIDGFQLSNVIGDPEDDEQQCTFSVNERGQYSQNRDHRFIRVEYELLERPESGDCAFASEELDSRESTSETVSIRVQKQLTSEVATNALEESFVLGYYDNVATEAELIINLLQNNLADAEAVYYWIAALIMDDADGNTDQINNLFTYFFEGEWENSNRSAYPNSVTSTGEYQRIEAYLCETAEDSRFRYDASRYCNG
jgi:hypothetical protein